MKFYLSSYKIGDKSEKLKEMMPEGNNKMAFISNALDFSDDLESRKESEDKDIALLKDLGFEVEMIDLRKYFGNESELKDKLLEFGGLWVRGGNCFVLRQAMKLSGLDNIILDFHKNKVDILYGGYSAGVCILGPSLKGLEIVDSVDIFPYKEISEQIWDGLGIVDYVIVPHYKSDHPESADIDKTVEYYEKNKIVHKPIRDGKVIIIE